MSLGVDYKDCVKRFIGFEPRVFHVSDGMLGGEKAEHLGIGGEEYDLGSFIHRVKENPFQLITIETPRYDKELLQEDIQKH